MINHKVKKLINIRKYLSLLYPKYHTLTERTIEQQPTSTQSKTSAHWFYDKQNIYDAIVLYEYKDNTSEITTRIILNHK